MPGPYRIPSHDEPWLVLAGVYAGPVPAGTHPGVDRPTVAVDTGVSTFVFDPALAGLLSYLAAPAPIGEVPVWFAENLDADPLAVLDMLEDRKLLASFAPPEDLDDGLAQFADVAFVPDLTVGPGRLPSSLRVEPRTPLPDDIPLSPWLAEADAGVGPVLRGDGRETLRDALVRAADSTGTPLVVVHAQFSLMLVDLLAYGCGFLRRV